MTTYGLMIDNHFCTGCHTCEVACKKQRELPLGQWGIKILELGPWKRTDGRTWEFRYVPVPTSDCDLCVDRVSAGDSPSCVLHCLANVIEYGTVEELAKRMTEKGRMCSLFLP
jgi:Fe-S-cluster-containing dehydrogenase component